MALAKWWPWVNNDIPPSSVVPTGKSKECSMQNAGNSCPVMYCLEGDVPVHPLWVLGWEGRPSLLPAPGDGICCLGQRLEENRDVKGSWQMMAVPFWSGLSHLSDSVVWAEWRGPGDEGQKLDCRRLEHNKMRGMKAPLCLNHKDAPQASPAPRHPLHLILL